MPAAYAVQLRVDPERLALAELFQPTCSLGELVGCRARVGHLHSGAVLALDLQSAAANERLGAHPAHVFQPHFNKSSGLAGFPGFAESAGFAETVDAVARNDERPLGCDDEPFLGKGAVDIHVGGHLYQDLFVRG